MRPLPNSPRFLSFWAINGPLDEAALCRQLEQLRAAGMDGVVFHPRFYPNEPPYLGADYLRIVSRTILHAKALGLAFWIYDEDGWPSGTVGGQLLRQHPDVAQRYLGLVRERPERCLGEFEHAGQHWYLADTTGPGVDYLNPELARHFLALTHERYRTGLTPEAFYYVEAFFCDEPEFGLGHAYFSLPPDGALPWTPGLPAAFRARYGEDLLPLIPQLFFPGADAEAMRVKFWELLTDLFGQAFLAPLDAWCRAHGKRFTAHIKGEEHPLFQVGMVGSCQQVFRQLSLPGIDALERFPGNHFFPRQVSSVARQFGDGRCMAEAFGGAGWGGGPADLEQHLLWLGQHGLTDFVLHLQQFRLDSAAIRDWPPSQPLNLSWRDAYPEVLDRVRRELRRAPRPAADTLVVAPFRGLMARYEPAALLQTNIHNAATYPDSPAGAINRRFMATIEALHRAGVAYETTDERTLEKCGQSEGQELRLGRGTYRRVIVDPGCRLTPAGVALTRAFEAETPVALGVAPAVIASPPDRCGGEATTAPVLWSLAGIPVNRLPLACVAESERTFTANFTSRLAPDATTEVELVTGDALDCVVCNGRLVSVRKTESGYSARLPSAALEASNVLRLAFTHRVEWPVVWVQGAFRVTSLSSFAAGASAVVFTEGPFVVESFGTTLGPDLIAGGFPFLHRPLGLSAELHLAQPITALRLLGVQADAVRWTVGAHPARWVWPAEGDCFLAVELPAGRHRLQIEIAPSTYNAFGPHHYYLADRFVISPDQFKGVRNFADPADAPVHTHVSAWHFRRFSLPHAVTTYAAGKS